MADFKYKEEDHEGLETLEAIGSAHAFNRWMYEQVKPFMKGEILEIGSGIGNISSFFLLDKSKLTLSDIRVNYCKALEKRFSGNPSLRQILTLDLVDPDFENKFVALKGKFDSVFALNVIEHIEDDTKALKNLSFLLKPEGRMLILVPAGQWLYNKLDKSLFHFRRYKRDEMQMRMKSAGIIVERSWYFNALGIPAWIYGGIFSKEDTIQSSQMNAYNRLVPLARLIDNLSFHKIGLSVIVAGHKAD